MDDLQFLSPDSVDNQVQGALGYKPKQTIKSVVSKVTDFDVNKSYGTPTKLLDNLRTAESSGDTYALHPETKAMGNYQFTPETAQTLNKRGIKFNPFDEQQSRAAADYYLSELNKQNNGDWNKTLAQYGGFKTKDPSQYVGKVMQGVNADTSAQAQTQQPVDDLDPLKYLSGANVDLAVQSALKEAPQAKPKPKTTTQELAQQATDFYQKNKMTPQEFEKESLLSPITKTLVGVSTGNIDLLKNAAADYVAKSESSVRGLGNIIMHPKETWKQISEHPAETAAGIAKGIIYNPTLNPLALKPKVAGIENLAADVARADKSTAGAMFPTPKESPYKSTGATAEVNAQFNAKKPTNQNVGAMQTQHESQVNAELASASPELQQKYANVHPSEIDVPALQTHKQFDKFGIEPTEGELHQDVAKMSDEWNSRAKPGNEALLERFNERNPKLIEGFNKIKEKVAPDVYEQDPVKLANMPLEKMATIDRAKLADIDLAYQKLAEANGGQLPLDGKSFAKTAEQELHKNLVTDALPSTLKNALKQFEEGRQMTFEDFKMLGTITAAEMRKGGSEAIAAGVVKNALENMNLTPEAAQLKPLLDNAKSLVKQRYDLIDPKRSTYVPAYAAAANDTRTINEIEQGVPHPAANTFIAKHYSEKTPQVNIQRMLDIIGHDTPEHQALNAAKINEFKLGSGIKNEGGNVSQAALNKLVHHQYASNLPVMLSQEALQDLHDLADVARKTEHIKGGAGFANTSNTYVLSDREAAKEYAKQAVATGLEAAVNTKTLGFGGTLARKVLKGNKEAKELAAQEALKKQELHKTLHPHAKKQTKLSDIDKEQK